jgi:hypothetical protein
MLIRRRPLLKLVHPGNEPIIEEAILREEKLEREADRQYWLPLRAELESLRLDRLSQIRR